MTSGPSQGPFNLHTDGTSQPRVYSSAEIEMFLQGEQREVDRLLLHGLNSLAATLIPHAEREGKVMDMIGQLGGPDAILQRSAFVKQLMDREEAKIAMMQKVSQSALAWTLIAFLGFLATTILSYIIDMLKAKLGGA